MKRIYKHLPLLFLLSFVVLSTSCAKERPIEEKQLRTDWAYNVKIESNLPVRFENGAVWEDVFHADAIDTLVYSYVGKANTDVIKSQADKIWKSSDMDEVMSLGFTDVIYLWINPSTKKEWGVYSSKNGRWYQTLNEYVNKR